MHACVTVGDDYVKHGLGLKVGMWRLAKGSWVIVLEGSLSCTALGRTLVQEGIIESSSNFIKLIGVFVHSQISEK